MIRAFGRALAELVLLAGAVAVGVVVGGLILFGVARGMGA